MYDAGIQIVLAGRDTIILGAVVAFLVRPIVLGRRGAAGGAAGCAGGQVSARADGANEALELRRESKQSIEGRKKP